MILRRSLERALTMRMAPTSRAWQQLADEALAEIGVSESAARSLAYLDRLGPDTRQGELARAIGIAEASLVRTLHQLQGAGFVTRVADEADRRANRLRLTASGRALTAQIDTRLAGLRENLLQGFADAELQMVVGLFEAMAERIADRRGRS